VSGWEERSGLPFKPLFLWRFTESDEEADEEAHEEAYIQADEEANIQADEEAYIQADEETYIQADEKAYIQANIQAYTQAYIQAYTQADIDPDGIAHSTACRSGVHVQPEDLQVRGSLLRHNGGCQYEYLQSDVPATHKYADEAAKWQAYGAANTSAYAAADQQQPDCPAYAAAD